MTTLFFVATYGYPLAMVAYAYLDHRSRNRKFSNTGMRL